MKNDDRVRAYVSRRARVRVGKKELSRRPLVGRADDRSSARELRWLVKLPERPLHGRRYRPTFVARRSVHSERRLVKGSTYKELDWHSSSRSASERSVSNTSSSRSARGKASNVKFGMCRVSMRILACTRLTRAQPHVQRVSRACKGARSLLQRFIDATTRNEER